MNKEFDAVKEKERIVKWIRDWFEKNGPKASAVVGVSGGKDSSVVTALCMEALGKDRVVGILMPNGVQSDIADSEKLVEHLGVRHYTVNINGAFNAMQEALSEAGFGRTPEEEQNLPPRLRMSVLYAAAQSIENGGRVANTCNLSEDYIGYSTKWGDSAGDFAPLAQYTATEVIKIGETLPIPDELVHKAPSDGLCGKTDEDNLGFTYETLDKYIRTGICENQEIKEKIDRRHRLNKHKIEPMPVCTREN
ncbi:NAD+ synthase [Lachnospiraceae bacterium]|nr:NAD+ synthase [Lachnospiraceae bacterium]